MISLILIQFVCFSFQRYIIYKQMNMFAAKNSIIQKSGANLYHQTFTSTAMEKQQRWRTAVRETGVSWHDDGPIKGPLKSL